MNPKSTNLTDGPIVKGIITFSIPILISSLLQQLYNSVDSAILGKYAGANELAAAGSAAALINLLIGLFLGIATGAGILYAMHYGAGDYKGLKKLIDSSLLLSAVFGIIISVISIIFIDDLMGLMSIPDSLWTPSKDYLIIILLGTTLNLIYNVGAGLIRSEGDSIRPLIYLAVGGMFNLVADVVLVKYYHMGTAGAAWATIAAQGVTAVLVIIRLTRLDERYAFRIARLKPDKVAIWDIIRISVPCGLLTSMFNISNFIVQIKINEFGAVAMAGSAAYLKIDSFIYAPMAALSLGISTFVGQNIGAGKFDRMKKGIVSTLVASFSITVTICTFIYLFYYPLMSIFTNDEELLEYGRILMLYTCPFTCIYSIPSTLNGVIRGSGQAVPVTVITALSICVFRIIWLEIVLKFYPTFGMICLCYPISWTLCALGNIWYYFRRSTLRKTMLSQCV